MNAPVPALAPESAPTSPAARIVNTFVAPSKTFRELHRNASWWMAWLLLAVVSLGFVYTVDQKIGMEQVTRTELARNPRAAEQLDRLSPEQRAQRLAVAAKFTRIAYYASPLLSLVFYLLVAAVLLGTFNFALGAQVPFKVALAITVYGFLPSAIAGILGILGLLLGMNPEGFNPRNPVASNPAYFMDPNTHKFLYGVASTLDIFTLWIVVLLGIGFACQSKVKRATAISVVLGWYLLVKLVGAGWTALS